ncbi:DUF4942 domain-containing protein [Listeria sp. ILCC797]|uniref:DUF4942 domain-containing protein n=1 Tax=Listeria sp. ILCC797 TaxID=1918333 RepID=UPI000B59611D|nr:DUF4942 domain-containing protein [Listeria sp. ILCC797]
MFNDNFYPSPKEVQRLLTKELPEYQINKILEPSAGKGDLVQHLQKKFSHAKIDVVEKEPDCCHILNGQGFPVLGNDFLQFHTYTEYDAIVMNPPFSEGDKHVLHAIHLAEGQVQNKCVIHAIVNAETIRNPFSKTRQKLALLCQKYHAKITFHSDLFQEAERRTNVETAIIRMTVSPTTAKVDTWLNEINKNVKNHLESQELETSLSTFLHSQELAERVEKIQSLVMRYDYHVKKIKAYFESQKALEYLESLLEKESELSFCSVTNYGGNQSLNACLESVRERYWEAILNTDEFRKNLTVHGKTKLNQYLMGAAKLEINLDNIKLLLQALIQNADDMLLDSCVHMFDNITQYHHEEYANNIHYYDGWDTNSAFKVNKKIILPLMNDRVFDLDQAMGKERKFGQKDAEVRYAYQYIDFSVKNYLDDLMKMFQMLDPHAEVEFQTIARGEFENGVFRFKMFNKGTVHIWFKDMELLEKFNKICGQQKNWVPCEEEIKTNLNAKEFTQRNFPKMKQLQEA